MLIYSEKDLRDHSYCKFRLSAHKLAIESGRYHSTSRNNRFCNACNTDVVEDEIHFLFHCEAYSQLRIKHL